MMSNSVGNTKIQGSNLNIAGNLLSNSLGNFTIEAAQNSETSTSQTSYETAGASSTSYSSPSTPAP